MLSRRLLECGPGALKACIDDLFCTFEWGVGGMTHLHCILWSAMSPRIDVVAENEKARTASGQEGLRLEPDVVNQMATYYDQYISEIHPSNPKEGAEGRVSAKHPDGARTRNVPADSGASDAIDGAVDPARRANRSGLPLSPDTCPEDKNERRSPKRAEKKRPPRTIRDPCAVEWGDLRDILSESGSGSEADFDRRIEMIGELVDFSNVHDWHLPYARGHPAPHQSCAKCARGAEGTDNEVIYCGKLFPRDPVREGYEVLREDPSRPDLFRIWLRRNCAYVNNFNPLIMSTLLANMDIQGCTSKYGVVSYMTKYITHHGAKKGSPQVAAEKELDACLTRAQEEGKGARLGITRWFNAQVAPGILTQLEVCHVNWGFERYLHSRDFSSSGLMRMGGV